MRDGMHTRRITKDDFDAVVEVIDRWWDGPINTFAHPIFFYELGEHAMVVHHREEGSSEPTMIGFLLGFIASSHDRHIKTGYVHLVGIHPDYRRRGVGRLLYDGFTESCVREGCERMKAITTLGNEGSQRFHLAQGWEANEIDDYAGPGRRRIVFTRDLRGVERGPGGLANKKPN